MSLGRALLLGVVGLVVSLTPSCGSAEAEPGTFDDCPFWSVDGRTMAFVRRAPIPESSPKQPTEAGRLYTASPAGFHTTKGPLLPPHFELTGWSLGGRIALRPATGGRVTFMDVRSGRRSAARRGAVVVRNGERYVVTARGGLVRLWRRRPPASLTRVQPVWSPDRRSIAFTAIQAGPDSRYQIYVTRADGTGRRRLTDNEENVVLESPIWSPDGKRLLYGGSGLHALDLAGHEEVLTDESGGIDSCAAWSPAGGWIAFLRIWPGGILRAGQSVVMVVRTDGSEVKRLAE